MQNCGMASALAVGVGTIFTAAMVTLSAHGNPVFDGWYADPQIRIYGDTYWVFPTTSARYKQQPSFDAFSSRDMKTWTKHPRILTTNEVLWVKGAMWAPDKPHMGVAVNLKNFGAGFDVDWLPKAQGTLRKTFPFAPAHERPLPLHPGRRGDRADRDSEGKVAAGAARWPI